MAGWAKRQWEFVCGLVLLGGFCCITAVPRLAYFLVFGRYPLPTLAVSVTAVGTLVTVRASRTRRANRRLSAWTVAGNWRPAGAGAGWPWEPLTRYPDSTAVTRAWRSVVDGFPVTAGELLWNRNALDGAVDPPDGRGVFVIVRLPQLAEPMSMRRPARTIGTSRRLDSPALRDAFENGEIPPWTVQDQELFAFEATKGPLDPAALDDLIRRSLRVVDLLDLGPDRQPER